MTWVHLLRQGIRALQAKFHVQRGRTHRPHLSFIVWVCRLHIEFHLRLERSEQGGQHHWHEHGKVLSQGAAKVATSRGDVLQDELVIAVKSTARA